MNPIPVKEHLDLIVQFIETQLLELDAKKTKGEWRVIEGVSMTVIHSPGEMSSMSHADCRFIAAAGTNAAKGWRITLKTINNLVPVMEVNDKADFIEVWQQEIIQTILAEFPVESLHT